MKNLEIKENVSLSELTTFKIGGKARFFIAAKNESEIVEALKFAGQSSLEVFVLGGGSNVLIADEGFDGLVLQVVVKGISIDGEKDATVNVTAQAGEDWDGFVAFCVEKNLQGIECLSGIPGLTGGTPVQNVGAYGQEVSETIVSVRCVNRETGKIVEMRNDECNFAYRSSVFNTTEKNRYIVSSVTFALKPGGEPKIVYRDLQSYFAGKHANLQETRDAVLQIRAAKSMVIDVSDSNSKSAGSFFKNPILANENFTKIEQTARNIGFQNAPFYKVDEKTVKIPAAWLIEKSGFQKGFRFGNVGISSNHTLAIVNFDDAKATDVLSLMKEIQLKVNEKFGVSLKPEPVFVGFKNFEKRD